MKKTQKNKGSLSRRLHFPEEERRFPWLPMLLDAYAIADTGIAVALRDAEKKQKKKLACGKGCGNCCEHQRDLPLYPHELVGIDGSCSIHPMRPIGCRQFNVFTKPCARGEDPYYTRREDVLVPISDYTDRAFAAVLPFYDMKREGDLTRAVKLVRSQIMNLQTFNWNKLVALIEQTGSPASD
jgi:hypothetical protein